MLNERSVHRAPLPRDFRASLARHDGQRWVPGSRALFWHKDTYELLSIEAQARETAERRAMAREPQAAPGMWSRAQIAIGHAGSGDALSLDLRTGLLRLASHDSEPSEEDRIELSFGDWLVQFAADLERGRYRMGRYSIERTMPDSEGLTALGAEVVAEVAAADGSLADVIERLAERLDQPEWIVTYFISRNGMEFALRDAKASR